MVRGVTVSHPMCKTVSFQHDDKDQKGLIEKWRKLVGWDGLGKEPEAIAWEPKEEPVAAK